MHGLSISSSCFSCRCTAPLPPPHPPPAADAPLWGALRLKFNGETTSADLALDLRSLGIRSVIARAENDPRLEIVGHLARDWWHIEYHKRMRAATFCGAFPGDGWSGGISSAIFAGCVPLIISDGIELPFENVLDYSRFSLRVAEADIPRLPALLRAIPPHRIAELQRGVRAEEAWAG